MSLPVPVSWFGGKTHLRDFILPHIEHSGKIYVEAFCGSANIFFAKQPHPVEVLNDLNGDIVNFFRVIQSRKYFRHFARQVRWTPYAADEFEQAVTILATPPINGSIAVDRAWAFFVRGTMGFGGDGDSVGNWRRSFLSGQGTATVVSNWRMRLSMLEAWRDRLAHAQIDHKPALEVMQYWDSPDTTFYLDPPYVEETRVSLDVYSHEMSNTDHIRLIDALLKLKGRVVLSGYATSIYSRIEAAGWQRLERTVLSPMTGFNDGKRAERTEVLWINRSGAQTSLFLDQRTETRSVEPPVELPSPEPIAESMIVAKAQQLGLF